MLKIYFTKSLFSERYKALQFREMRKVRSKLEQTPLNLWHKAERLSTAVEALNRTKLETNEEISKAKKHLQQLRQMRNNLHEQIGRFIEFAQPYFTKFNPSRPSLDDSLGYFVHKLHRQVEHIDTYFYDKQAYIRMAEIRKSKTI